MRKNLTEIVFILDMSGSMYSLVQDTIGGYNSMIGKQRNVNGDVVISTVLFNNNQKVIHDRVKLQEVPMLTDQEYEPHGCTALLDAIGSAIHHIGNIHKYARDEDVPEHTVFVITTDGLENASRIYSSSTVKTMIKRQKEKYGWEFIFLGANIDAADTAEGLGIDRNNAVDYIADPIGTKACYDATSDAIFSIRSAGKLNKKWKGTVEEDYKTRK